MVLINQRVCARQKEKLISHSKERNLSLRLKEHKTNYETAELDKSAMAKHSWTNNQRLKWSEVSILATESHKFSRKMKESIEIEKHSTIEQEGNALDSTWRALFTMNKSIHNAKKFPKTLLY